MVDTFYNTRASRIVALVVCIPLFTNFFGAAFNFFGISTTISTLIIYGIVFAYEFFCFFKLSSSIFIKYIALLFSISLFFLLNYCLSTNSQVYFRANITELLVSLLIYLPAAIYLTKITDHQLFFNALLKISFITPIAGLLAIFSFKVETLMNYMVFSAMMLPGTLASCYFLVFTEMKKVRRIGLIISLIVDVYILLIFGGRAAFLAVIVYLVLLWYRKINAFSSKKRLAITILLLIGLFVLVVGRDLVLSVLSNVLSPFRSSSRIVDTIVAGKFFQSNEVGGRSQIYSYAFDGLKHMGFSINGLFGDRIVLLKYMASSTYKTNYVHNVFLEILLSFGWVFGILIIGFLIIRIIKRILMKSDETTFHFATYFFCLIFVRLLVSGSFLVEGVSLLFFASLTSSIKPNKLSLCYNKQEMYYHKKEEEQQ